MSPRKIVGSARLPGTVCLALWLAALPGGARAIVGATSEAHPMARSSVMVLSSRGGVCTAIVLAPDLLLTAAHCVAPGLEYRVHWASGGGAPELVAPAEIRRHPGYSPGAETTRRRSIDVALLRLPAPLPSGFVPASLATGRARAGAGVTVAGYGVAREGDGRSSGVFRSAALTVVEPHGPGKVLLWAEPREGEAGACQGDSGGPILGPEGEVMAVTSWARGRGGRACGALTQGVLVAPLRPWIDATVSHWGRTARWN